MQTNRPLLSRAGAIVAGSVLALLFTTARAQTAGAAPALASSPAESAANSSKDNDVVVLSPFTVSASANNGYLANDTLAGSRLRTTLSDIASSVSVFTPEFISDLAATDEADLMRYSAAAQAERTDQTPAVQGISPMEGIFTFRVRGQTATRARNYFETNLAPDLFNAESVEEARGPNSILFGVGAAGGVLNTSTKRALLNHNAIKLGVTVASNQDLRTTLDVNQALGRKFAVRFNAVYQTAESWQPNTESENTRLAFAATYRPWKKLTLTFDSEYGKWDAPITRNFAPFDQVSLWRASGSPLVANGVLVASAAQKAIGINNRNATNPRLTLVGNDNTVRNFQGTAISLPLARTANAVNSTLFPDVWAGFDSANPYPLKANFSGPGGHADYEQGAYSLIAELQPFQDFFVELAGQHDENVHHIYDAVPDQAFGSSFNGIFGEPAQTYRDGSANPYAGTYYVDTRWVHRVMYFVSNRYRMTAAYSFDLGKFGRHTVAGLLSRDHTNSPRHTDFLAVDGAPFNASPFAAQNLLYTRQYITNSSDLTQWSSVPSYESLLGQNFATVLSSGATPTSYTGVWARNASNHIYQTERAAMVSLQDYFFSDRLVTTAGFRRTLNEQQVSVGTIAANALNTLSYGAVFRITPWLSAFYNYSENALAPSSVQTVIPYNNLIPVNSGEGIDMGLMLKLLKDRVFIRLGHYDTTSISQTKAAAVGANVVTRNQNITAAMIAAGLPVPADVLTINGGDFDASDVKTTGYELSAIANLTDSWRLTLSATKSDSISTNLLKLVTELQSLFLPVWQTSSAQSLLTASNITVAQEIANYQVYYNSNTAGNGRLTVGHSPLQVRLFSRYDVKSGRLKGVFFGGGLSYNSAPNIGYNTTTGAPYKARVQRDADLLLGYRTRLPGFMRKAQASFQLNVQNILRPNDFILVSMQGDGQILRAVVVPPTRFVFSTKLDF